MGERTYTHPDVLDVGVREGWADPETDPTRINWEQRQKTAAIPFTVVNGRPVNPCEKTGIRYGRNELGYWGECQCADALVFVCDPAGARWVLMVERRDGHGWAIPGGKVDPEDTDATAAAIRELAEETGLHIPNARWETTPPCYVPDPRASDEAWMVTTVCVAHLGRMETFPTVAGADDAKRAAWVRADSYTVLTTDLAETYGGTVFRAHARMLQDAL